MSLLHNDFLISRIYIISWQQHYQQTATKWEKTFKHTLHAFDLPGVRINKINDVQYYILFEKPADMKETEMVVLVAFIGMETSLTKIHNQ